MMAVRIQVTIFAALAAVVCQATAQESTGSVAKPLNTLSSFDPALLDGFRDRPLFSPSRRPASQTVSDVALTAAASSQAPDIRLVGVIDTPEGAVAHIADNDTGSGSSLRAGDMFRDWKVVSVGTSSLTMRRDDTSNTYDIFARSNVVSAGVTTEVTPISNEELLEPKTVRIIELAKKPEIEKPIDAQPDINQRTQDMIDVFGKNAISAK